MLKRDLLCRLLGLEYVRLGLSVILPLPALDRVGDPVDFLAATIAREMFLPTQATGWFARVVVWRI